MHVRERNKDRDLRKKEKKRIFPFHITPAIPVTHKVYFIHMYLYILYVEYNTGYISAELKK